RLLDSGPGRAWPAGLAESLWNRVSWSHLGAGARGPGARKAGLTAALAQSGLTARRAADRALHRPSFPLLGTVTGLLRSGLGSCACRSRPESAPAGRALARAESAAAARAKTARHHADRNPVAR